MEIIFKRETTLGLESFEDLGFNSEEDLELESQIRVLIQRL